MRSPILYVVTLDAAEAAVTWQVAQVSKAWQSPVVLMAVGQPPWLGFLGGKRAPDLKSRLVEVAQRLRGLKGHVSGVKAAIGEGAQARAEIVRVARYVGAELIMIGAGAGAMADPGFCADEVQALARHAREDVWICKPHADANLEHVLCAADATAPAGDAVQRSAEICRRFNARLRVLSVLADPEPARGDADAEARLQAGRQAQREFLARFDLQGLALSRATVWGAHPGVGASIELLLEAERYPDGLLVIGASSDRGAGKAGLGATAERVLRACPSSLLIVKQRVADDGAPRKRAAAGAGTAVA